MTEAEWLTHTKPIAMLSFVRRTTSDRKWRLFAVACARQVLPLLTEDWHVRAVELAEQLADGLIPPETATEFREQAPVCSDPTPWVVFRYLAVGQILGVPEGTNEEADEFVQSVASHASLFATSGVLGPSAFPVGKDRLSYQNPYHCEAVRDIFGNPFRPVAFDPAWRTDTAVSVAKQMYGSRDFGAMPILADALQDAGCTSDDILSHCRGDGPHVRGCWVEDLVLGK
jgi:hypothetical protein